MAQGKVRGLGRTPRLSPNSFILGLITTHGTGLVRDQWLLLCSSPLELHGKPHTTYQSLHPSTTTSIRIFPSVRGLIFLSSLRHRLFQTRRHSAMSLMTMITISRHIRSASNPRLCTPLHPALHHLLGPVLPAIAKATQPVKKVPISFSISPRHPLPPIIQPNPEYTHLLLRLRIQQPYHRL